MTPRPLRFFGQTAAAAPPDPEPEPQLHEYSSTQVNIAGRAADAMRKMAAQIPDSDLVAEEGSSYGGKSASDGRENEPHVTVFYGLHFQSPSKRMRAAIAAFGPITLTLGKTSLFSNKDADVLKVDVTSPDLRRLHSLIGRLAPTHQTFPTYIPHATIAYLKPGRGKKYAGERALAGMKLNFDSVLFSGKKGHKELLPLKGNSPAFPPR